MTRTLTFDIDHFLSKQELQRGHIYVQKDGRLTIYLGKDIYDRYVFYDLAGILFESTGEYGKLTIGHYATQVHSLTATCNTLMKSPCNLRQIRSLKGVPSLYSDYKYINYEAVIDDWCEKNKKLTDKFPNLVKDVKETSKKVWVSARDLVPGELYYTGSLWGGLYLYLGRDSQNRFCWMFVGNEERLIQNDFSYYRYNMERTKSNKKCKRLAYALKDPDAYLYQEARDLIAMGWKADLTGLDLD